MATHEIYQVDDFDDALLTDDLNDNFVEADTMLKLDPLAKRRRIEELLESKKLLYLPRAPSPPGPKYNFRTI